MKRILTKILCPVILIILGTSNAQSQEDKAVRLGFQTSPLISWISNGDNTITKTGGNIGFKLGTTADIHFKDNYSFTLGLNLAFHQGGEFRYETGGKYLPKSDLSEPDILQLGDKPMPDGTKIRYNLQYVEIPFGLKIKSKEMGYFRYFVEAPIFTLGFLTRGRGDIESDAYKFEGENIYKDLNLFNIFWGLGAGLEYTISEHNSLIGGLYFQNGLIDFTEDNGHRAELDPEVAPLEQYIIEKDDSRATVSSIVLKLGILF